LLRLETLVAGLGAAATTGTVEDEGFAFLAVGEGALAAAAC
jgi:hypothetical protein